jgi:hypothetical protein
MTLEPSLVEEGEDRYLAKFESQSGQRLKYVLLPELGHLSDAPVAIGKGDQEFRLVFNGWLKKRAKFLGLKVGGVVPGYQFALYERLVKGADGEHWGE